jgi:hypothetical protein
VITGAGTIGTDAAGAAGAGSGGVFAGAAIAAVEKPPHTTCTYMDPGGGVRTVMVGDASSTPPVIGSYAVAQQRTRPSAVRHAAWWYPHDTSTSVTHLATPLIRSASGRVRRRGSRREAWGLGPPYWLRPQTHSSGCVALAPSTAVAASAAECDSPQEAEQHRLREAMASGAGRSVVSP